MINQESQHIREFIPGELITKIKPSIIYESDGQDLLGNPVKKEVHRDPSHVGKCYEFKGIANGKIWLGTKDYISMGNESKIIGIEYDLHQEDWAIYINTKKTIQKETQEFIKI